MLKNHFIKQLFNSFLDLVPILAVVFVFQVLIIKQPIPDVISLIIGTVFVVFGLALFVQGLEQSFFPLGESLAYAFARKGSAFWLLSFAFCLGFGTTVADPALIAIINETTDIVSQANIITHSSDAKMHYSLGLRFTVALSVGVAILIGVLRIIHGWSLSYLLIGGYGVVLVMTLFAPAEIIGIAYDLGGVTASTITVPLVATLGLGLATTIKGRNPMIDGFGLIAFGSLTPMIFVMAYGAIL
ncbi:MAG: hypothetical protein CG439_288 [Methylococcaceae bacterium NSP1-2]|nr:DUF1538 domain-containing protein [Methylococcaceae bacterium]OYV20950.1 MAG: hypothetical protein CG439_288 [Methylococcaceae bacterium NSP1-2]